MTQRGIHLSEINAGRYITSSGQSPASVLADVPCVRIAGAQTRRCCWTYRLLDIQAALSRLGVKTMPEVDMFLTPSQKSRRNPNQRKHKQAP